MSGYFERDSAVVRVMSKRAVGYTYGLRALVIGAANPRLYVGTAAHTEHRDTPYTRLAITGHMFEAVFLGTKEEADRALAFTARKHTKVVGSLPEDAGAHHPAGTPYSAFDPHLMFMTMAFTFDSAERMHDLLVRRLTDREREQLWQDYVRWAELFGMPRSAAPATYPEFRAYFDAYLESDELFLTAEAELVGSYLAGLRSEGFRMKPEVVSNVNALVVQGSLPPRIRELYGMRWRRRDEAAFQAVVAAVRAVHRRPGVPLPFDLRNVLVGDSDSAYKMVSKTERENVRHGRASMPGVDLGAGLKSVRTA
ncbi:oxygenase MpaB family protein [Antrihabitans sp. YC2-6]|uniref:oxygenase MpaB family protein n=1 Tax=Antrihabitans sp. YC2-6 TaxID=2799498 RepID=UPI0018F53BD4|nr:oxygenase MpaB family protein [Antrihabitans sp. YC2-6]MBJ8345348.1 DUF2236 domain-containing protein [Antrihabitans sp. YC2-6]